MAKKMVNIRLEESVWRQAKMEALKNDMTLQDWVTYALLKAVSDGVK